MNPFAMPRPPVRSEEGMTLLEILVVLAMIGIFALVAIPAVSDALQPHKVVEQARRVHAQLGLARARAMAEQKEYRFRVSGGDEYRLEYSEPGADDWTTYGGVKAVDGNGVTVAIDGAGTGEVVFKPTGRAGAPVTVRVEDAGRWHEIDVQASGMASWSGSGK